MKEYNIVEILQEFKLPKSCKLYTPIVGDVYLLLIADNTVTVITDNGDQLVFNNKGQYIFNGSATGEMMLFPDEYIRDWYYFSSVLVMRSVKEGDFVSFWEDNKPSAVGIVKNIEFLNASKNELKITCYAGINFVGEFFTNKPLTAMKITYACSEKKKELMIKIAEHGFRWDNYNKKLEQLKYDWKTALQAEPNMHVIVFDNNEWFVNKLVSIEPNTQLPFTCIDNKKYRYCMPYSNKTYDYVFTDKEVESIYDISI